MKIQTGWRYRASVPGGELEGVLGVTTGTDVWPEGGGEVRVARWELHLDDGRTVEVQEVALAPMERRGLGPQPGPFRCPACEGTGSRAKPKQLAASICGNCSGEGILYPADIWTLFSVKRSPEQRRQHYMQIIGRLKPGVTLEQASAAINVPYSAILTNVEVPLQQGLSEKMMAKFKGKKLEKHFDWGFDTFVEREKEGR